MHIDTSVNTFIHPLIHFLDTLFLNPSFQPTFSTHLLNTTGSCYEISMSYIDRKHFMLEIAIPKQASTVFAKIRMNCITALFPHFEVILPYPTLSHHNAILPYPILPYPILFYPLLYTLYTISTLSYPILSYSY